MQHDLVKSHLDLDIIAVHTYKNEKVIRGERFRSKAALLTSVTSGD